MRRGRGVPGMSHRTGLYEDVRGSGAETPGPGAGEMSPSPGDAHKLTPKPTSQTRNPRNCHAKPNRLLMNLTFNHSFVLFIARFPPDYLSFLTDH